MQAIARRCSVPVSCLVKPCLPLGGVARPDDAFTVVKRELLTTPLAAVLDDYELDSAVERVVTTDFDRKRIAAAVKAMRIAQALGNSGPVGLHDIDDPEDKHVYRYAAVASR
jgi:hypothetical protein